MKKHHHLSGLHLAIATCILFAGCVKTPSACYSSSSRNDSVGLGETVTFDADCSKSGTEYLWTVDSASGVSGPRKLAVHEGRDFTYTFRKKGTMRVTLTVTRKKTKRVSTAKLFQVN